MVAHFTFSIFELVMLQEGLLLDRQIICDQGKLQPEVTTSLCKRLWFHCLTQLLDGFSFIFLIYEWD